MHRRILIVHGMQAQDDDLAAFIACNDYGDGPVPAQEAIVGPRWGT